MENAPDWMMYVAIAFMLGVFAFVFFANKRGQKNRELARESGTRVQGVVTEVRELHVSATARNREENQQQGNTLAALASIGQQIANAQRGGKANLRDFSDQVSFQVEYKSPFTGEHKRTYTTMNWQKEYYPEDLLEYSIPNYPYRDNPSHRDIPLPKSAHRPVTLYVAKHPKKANKEIVAASFTAEENNTED